MTQEKKNLIRNIVSLLILGLFIFVTGYYFYLKDNPKIVPKTACVINVGEVCESAKNACGLSQSNGSIECDGSCSSTPPPIKEGFDSSCNLNRIRPTVSISPNTEQVITQGNKIVFESTVVDNFNDITRHHIDLCNGGPSFCKDPLHWINAASWSQFSKKSINNLVYEGKPTLIGNYMVKASVCDNESSGFCRWTESEWVSVVVKPLPAPGFCGASSGKTFWSGEDIQDFCSVGEFSPVKFNKDTGPWTWTCSGVNGGVPSPLCTAYPQPINGLSLSPYSPDVNVYYPQKPTSLCYTGKAIDFSGTGEANDPWVWTCEGEGLNHIDDAGAAYLYTGTSTTEIKFNVMPRSVSPGGRIILNWEIINPNGYCKITASSSDDVLTKETSEYIKNINDSLVREKTDRTDPRGSREMLVALKGAVSGTDRAMGKKTLIIDRSIDLNLSCSPDGTDTNSKKAKINVVRNAEG